MQLKMRSIWCVVQFLIGEPFEDELEYAHHLRK